MLVGTEDALTCFAYRLVYMLVSRLGKKKRKRNRNKHLGLCSLALTHCPALIFTAGKITAGFTGGIEWFAVKACITQLLTHLYISKTLSIKHTESSVITWRKCAWFVGRVFGDGM